MSSSDLVEMSPIGPSDSESLESQGKGTAQKGEVGVSVGYGRAHGSLTIEFCGESPSVVPVDLLGGRGGSIVSRVNCFVKQSR